MRGRRRLHRKPHPTLLVLSVLGWTIAVYELATIVQQVLLLLVVWAVLWMSSANGARLWQVVIWSLPMMLLYAFVSSVFGQTGGDVLWRGGHIPMLGTLTISTNSLQSGVVKALRIWNLLTLFIVVMRKVTSDDIAHWLGRRFSRVSLTLSIILNFMPNLLEERQRVNELVRLRGAVGTESPRTTRLRAHAVVYQTLLMNALERSWRLAESMHVRGYSGMGRTLYHRAKWYPIDVWMSVAILGGLCLDVVLLMLNWALRTEVWPYHLLQWGTACIQVICLVWMGGRLRV